MKKLTSFLMIGVAVLMTACNNSAEKKTSATDSHQGEPFETVINIRYVNTDSIGQYYMFAQEVKTQVEQLSLEYNRNRSTYENQLMQKGNNIEQKRQQNQYLSEQSLQNDVSEYQRLQNYYSQQLSQFEQQAAQKTMELQAALQDSINNFITEFNKTHKYDAILDRQAGLYFNPALDITKEVIEGLNARYMGNAAAPADTTKTVKK